MLNTTRTLLILAALALPLSAYAQSSDTEETTTETATEQTQTATEEAPADLSLGVEAQPEPYVKAEHGDWQLQCLRVPGVEGDEAADNEPCQLFQALQDDQGTKVAEITLFRLPDGGQAIAGANILVPLETLLSAQLTIRVDQGNPRRYPYSFCSPIGCFARIGFTAQDIQNMKKGAVAKVSLRPAPAPEEVVTLDMSLTGFTAGYDSLKPLDQ